MNYQERIEMAVKGAVPSAAHTACTGDDISHDPLFFSFWVFFTVPSLMEF
jgi:hypothetical protein